MVGNITEQAWEEYNKYPDFESVLILIFIFVIGIIIGGLF